jgi:hypothetical protein
LWHNFYLFCPQKGPFFQTNTAPILLPICLKQFVNNLRISQVKYKNVNVTPTLFIFSLFVYTYTTFESKKVYKHQ